MISYIALLRGINVGGHVVKMEQLRALFAELGFHNVRSYITSGNIFFDTEEADRASLTAAIEAHLLQALGYAVPTFLRTTDELESLLQQEPFRGIELTSDTRFCVMFTNQRLNLDIPLPQSSSRQDMELVALHSYEAFIVWHIINGRPPSGTFPADIIPPNSTTRFYHTLAKIVAAATSL